VFAQRAQTTAEKRREGLWWNGNGNGNGSSNSNSVLAEGAEDCGETQRRALGERQRQNDFNGNGNRVSGVAVAGSFSVMSVGVCCGA
jgi:hypothetical protein